MTNNSYFKITIIFFILVFCAHVDAIGQNYLVYSVIGKVSFFQGGREMPLSARKSIVSKTKVNISRESALTILDESNNKMYSFTKEGVTTINDLISQMKNSSKNLSKQYVNYLVKQLFSAESQKMSHPDTYMQSTATSYRSVTSDSLLINKICQMLPTTVNESTEQLLCQPKNLLSSDFDVRFNLVSCTTGLPIEREVDKNTSCYARVHNGTSEALYVNILDVDDKGKKYLVLPVDAAATCSHLLVPANSTVSFKSEPFIFSDKKSKDAFLLVATEEPIDFSILMGRIKSYGGKALKSGIYRLFYETK